MIEIICNNDKIVAELGDKQLVSYRGVIRIEGDKKLVEFQFSNILLDLMKTAPELVENAMQKAIENLDHDKNN